MGTEIEYLIFEEPVSFEGGTRSRRPAGNDGLRAILASIPPEYLLFDDALDPRYNGFVLKNGGRLYIDGSFLEYATPECLTAKELVAYEKAGDYIVSAGAKALRRETGRTLEIHKMISEAVVDQEIPGYHENYGLRQDRYFNLFMDNFWPRASISRVLIPFLVSRQLFAGAGSLAPDSGGTHFELSQRAKWIDTVFNYTTARRRPILHLKRPNLSETHLRVHITCGDPNMAEYSTFLKVGTTAIVLACLSQNAIYDVDLELANPIQAFKTVSKKGVADVHLKVGRQVSAIDIQERLLEKIENEHHRIARPEHLEWDWIMKSWRDTLSALREYPWESL